MLVPDVCETAFCLIECKTAKQRRWWLSLLGRYTAAREKFHPAKAARIMVNLDMTLGHVDLQDIYEHEFDNMCNERLSDSDSFIVKLIHVELLITSFTATAHNNIALRCFFRNEPVDAL